MAILLAPTYSRKSSNLSSRAGVQSMQIAVPDEPAPVGAFTPSDPFGMEYHGPPTAEGKQVPNLL